MNKTEKQDKLQQHLANRIDSSGESDADRNIVASTRRAKDDSWRLLTEPQKQTIIARYKRGVAPDQIAYEFTKIGEKVGQGQVEGLLSHHPDSKELRQIHKEANKQRVKTR